MQYEAERDNDISSEPSVADMTAKAIDILDNNEKRLLPVGVVSSYDHGHMLAAPTVLRQIPF